MKFSVIIPVYNKSNTIAASIKSVLAQEVDDREIIIVDDGSTDDLLTVLASFGDEIRLIQRENGGVSAARNTGIEAANGEFICFLDADDLWEPHHLTTLLAMMEKYPSYRYYLTAHTVIESNDKTRSSAMFLQDCDSIFPCEDLLGFMNQRSSGLVHTNSICIKKELLDEYNIRFAEGVKIGEDTDVWYRAALRDPVVLTKIPTTIYRREFSTATPTSFYTPDWVFASRCDGMMADPTISDAVKLSVAEICDRYYLTGARVCMKQKNRAGAKDNLRRVKQKSGKRYWLTYLFTLLPFSICRCVLRG